MPTPLPGESKTKTTAAPPLAPRRRIRIKWVPLALATLVLVNLVAGWLTAGDYGESWDERRRLRYGLQSLRAYTGETTIEDELDQEAKGPAYVMLAASLSGLLEDLYPSWGQMQAFHFVHFAFHQLGLVFLYLICKRVMSRPAALGAVVIYTTQPLLWGHAFINPKDTPFMTAFLGAVAAGMWMADAFSERYFSSIPDLYNAEAKGQESLGQAWSADWRALRSSGRLVLGILFGLNLVTALAVTLGARYTRRGLTGLVAWAYDSGPDGFPGALIRRFAAHWGNAPLDGYIKWALAVYPKLAVGLLAGALLLLVFGLARLAPRWSHTLWQAKVHPMLDLKAGWRLVRIGLSKPETYLSAALLGFCSAVRILGPVAGALVAAYFLLRAGRKSLPVLMVYATLSVAVIFLLWPGLWHAPLQTLWANLASATDFPWTSKVRFNGYDYFPNDLPGVYFPTLLALQLSEPTLALVLLGFVAAWNLISHRAETRPALATILAWFALPFLSVIALRPTMYDNFRHFLFTLPPLFVLAGLGLEYIWTGMRKLVQPRLGGGVHSGLAALVVLLALLPGILAIVRLHPYQYVYYNSLTGGVEGAFRRYELDYWATSYRETIERLNAIAPTGASIVAEPPTQILSAYARPDLTITRLVKNETDDPAAFDYAILPTRNDKDQKFFSQAETVYQIGYHDAVFVLVKRLKSALAEP